jgi:MFS family permease
LSTQPARPALREILSRDTLPIFTVFFSWSFGTGALWLVRPLFAYEIGGSFFAVALISATSAMPRLLMGPLTGYLSDRWGRRLFVLIGSSLGTIALTSDFFVNAYWQFLLLEVVAGTGIALYMTSSNLLMADATRNATRGRAMGVRQVSSRMGNLLGPVVAGGIAAAFGLRYVFLFIALTKVVVFLVTLFWIRDMRPERVNVSQTETEGQGPKQRLPDLSMFRNRSFFTLAAVTLALGLVNGGTGVFRTLFPPQMGIVAGVSESQIGLLIAVAGLTGLLVSMPVGIVSNHYGRKRLMVVGLLITAVATYLMAITIGFASAMIAVVVFGGRGGDRPRNDASVRHGPCSGGAAGRLHRRMDVVHEYGLGNRPPDHRNGGGRMGFHHRVRDGRDLPGACGVPYGRVRERDVARGARLTSLASIDTR